MEHYVFSTAKESNGPVALLVQKDSFEKSINNTIVNEKNTNYISRENAISIITENKAKFTLKNSTTQLKKVQDPLMIMRRGMFLDKNIGPIFIN